jgi:hypothetical protein
LQLGITAHYIDENFVMYSHLLAFERFAGAQDGANMANLVMKVLKEYNIAEKLFCITTDNATNNDTMASYLELKLDEEFGVKWDQETQHLYCLAHVINLVVNDFLDYIRDKTTDCKHILANIRTIAVATRRSTRRWERFQDACKESSMKPVSIPLDTDVRWNSTYRMLQRAIYLRKPIQRFVEEINGLKDTTEPLPKLSNSDWDMAETLWLILMPFYRCTMRFEGYEDEPDVEYVFWAYETMFNFVDDLEALLRERTSGSGRIPSAKTLLEALGDMRLKLKKYYGKQSNSAAIYYDAMLLNPRCKGVLMELESWQDVDVDKCISESRARFMEQHGRDRESREEVVDAAQNDSKGEPAKAGIKRRRIDPAFDEKVAKRARQTNGNDFDRWLAEPQDLQAESILGHWREGGHRYGYHQRRLMIIDFQC